MYFAIIIQTFYKYRLKKIIYINIIYNKNYFLSNSKFYKIAFKIKKIFLHIKYFYVSNILLKYIVFYIHISI